MAKYIFYYSATQTCLISTDKIKRGYLPDESYSFLASIVMNHNGNYDRKIYLKKYSEIEIKKLQHFYTNFYLLHSILNRAPRQIKGELAYFSSTEMIKIQNFIINFCPAMNLLDSDFIQNWNQKRRNWDS